MYLSKDRVKHCIQELLDSVCQGVHRSAKNLHTPLQTECRIQREFEPARIGIVSIPGPRLGMKAGRGWFLHQHLNKLGWDKIRSADSPSASPREWLCAEVRNPVPNEQKLGQRMGLTGTVYLNARYPTTLVRAKGSFSNLLTAQSKRNLPEKGSWKWEIRTSEKNFEPLIGRRVMLVEVCTKS
ncbi:hypothetical protein B0H13DRAFT_1904256 [Mycena leptocephala]|nr:hypothetical protein B0H13DRAFT_1904256 [Mycena leptocephala]